jgi:hypothetical protein
MLRGGAHCGDNRAFRPPHKLRIKPQLIQPARRGRLPILKCKRQRLRRPRQGVVQSVGGGGDAGEIGEGNAPAGGGGFVDEGDVGVSVKPAIFRFCYRIKLYLNFVEEETPESFITEKLPRSSTGLAFKL